ncbi:hypothetical protein [Egicoccus sp. AB-alg6-2]|uniref:hypothetical protein n=1 Tax=Egicoccus sp. AB-alg6-2 TaxID=3242692 RepID=UPI00359DBE2D
MRAARRRGLLAALTGTVLMLSAAPAAADPAGPTHYDSIVTGVEPGDVPVSVEILGGDAFLVLHVEPGVTAEVPGYEGEPYLRFEANGNVLVNERSPARWFNDARYGELEVDLPPHADADAEPVFTLVADDGTYAWHDHRIHFMSPSLPPQVDPTAGSVQAVTDWRVPIVVDGESVEILGELRWVPGPSPLYTGLLIAVALAGAALVVARRPTATPVVAAVAGVIALGVGVSEVAGLPAGTDAQPMLVVLPAMALGLLLFGWLLTRRGGSADVRGPMIAATAGIPVLVWGILHLATLWRPIVPGPLPIGVARIAVVLALAAGASAIGSLVRAVLAATSLDAPEDRATI